jgi:hypothetical protein
MREMARRGAEALGLVLPGVAPFVGSESFVDETTPAAVPILLAKCREMLR